MALISDRPLAAVLLSLLVFVLLTAGLPANAQPPLADQESYADRAERALLAGDLDLAKELFEQWLQADPGDHASWYNYACALALSDDLSRALAALQNAVATGWRDSTWAANDPDLRVLHDNALFASILTQMGRKNRTEQSERGENTRFTRQLRLAPYQVHLPFSYDKNPDRIYPLVVLLHGRGQDMDAMNDLRERLALPGIIYVQPRAPYPVEDGDTGFEYWPRSLTLHPNDSSAVRSARSLAGQWVETVVNDILDETRVDTNQVFVAGFSQGGAASYLAALESPGLFRGVASLGGFIPPMPVDSTTFLPLAANGVQMFIGHGRRDRLVQLGEAERARGLLEQAGVQVEYHPYPAEHEIPDEMIVDLADWILATCAAPVIKTVPMPDPAAVDSLREVEQPSLEQE